MVHTEIKSVVVGSAGSGKTSLSATFCLGSCPTNPASTVGASFLQKRVPTSSGECCLQIWDTTGQERFRALAPMYVRERSGHRPCGGSLQAGELSEGGPESFSPAAPLSPRPSLHSVPLPLTLLHRYYRGAKAAVVVADITNMDTIKRCQSWLDDLQQCVRGRASERA